MKGDRRLVEYQKKYEQRIQFLMNKLRDAESNETPDERITYVIIIMIFTQGHFGAWSAEVVIHGVYCSTGHFSVCLLRVFFPNFCFSSIL